MVTIYRREGGNTQSSNLLFSVIVPFLNEQYWLPRCLHALQNQSLNSSLFELIFVDNGSSDSSLAILSHYPQVSVLQEPHRDPYIARNKGIQAARGNYLVFLDADCIADPDWLTRLAEAVQNGNPAIVLGRIGYPPDISLSLLCYRDYYDQKIEHMLKYKLEKNYFGHAGNMAVHHSVFRSLGPFHPMPIVGDTEIMHRLTSQLPASQIAYCHNALVVHAEVTSFRICLHKIYESGQYTRTLSRLGGCQPLPYRERFRIFRACIHNLDYGLRTSLVMCFTLALGWLFFEAGRHARPKAYTKQSATNEAGAVSDY